MDIVERLRENVKWLERDGFLTNARNTADAADEIERLRHEREQLAIAIRNAAVSAGICRDDASLTGAELLMICGDMGNALRANAEVWGRRSAASSGPTRPTGSTAGESDGN